jgi:hypothetical protein
MKNFRPAPESVARAVERRLEKFNPGAQLVKKSVKLCPIPGTDFDATVFRYISKGRHALAAELCRPDLPHVYASFALKDNARANAAVILSAVLSLSKRIRTDRRFSRSNIIELSW